MIFCADGVRKRPLGELRFVLSSRVTHHAGSSVRLNCPANDSDGREHEDAIRDLLIVDGNSNIQGIACVLPQTAASNNLPQVLTQFFDACRLPSAVFHFIRFQVLSPQHWVTSRNLV
jgi:hypothetical protein